MTFVTTCNAGVSAITTTMTGTVNTPSELIEDPQLTARDLFERPAAAPPRVGFPAQSTAAPAGSDESVPGHGEHTEAVLAEAGVATDRIDTLQDQGVIG